MKVVALVLSLVLAPGWAFAKEAASVAEDPVLEAKMMGIANELRCLVCQNQTIADSDADLAKDLRREVRTMLKSGMEEKEVLDFMVDRYGDFVRYRPPVKWTTALLWFGPGILFVGGLAVLLFNVVRRRKQVIKTPLSDADSSRVEKLLNGAGEPKA